MNVETKLIEMRKPNTEEKERGAEIVFVRQDENGNKHTIYGRGLYESWEQWNAFPSVLGDNVKDVEYWRRNRGEIL